MLTIRLQRNPDYVRGTVLFYRFEILPNDTAHVLTRLSDEILDRNRGLAAVASLAWIIDSTPCFLLKALVSMSPAFLKRSHKSHASSWENPPRDVGEGGYKSTGGTTLLYCIILCSFRITRYVIAYSSQLQ